MKIQTILIGPFYCCWQNITGLDAAIFYKTKCNEPDLSFILTHLLLGLVLECFLSPFQWPPFIIFSDTAWWVCMWNMVYSYHQSHGCYFLFQRIQVLEVLECIVYSMNGNRWKECKVFNFPTSNISFSISMSIIHHSCDMALWVCMRSMVYGYHQFQVVFVNKIKVCEKHNMWVDTRL